MSVHPSQSSVHYLSLHLRSPIFTFSIPIQELSLVMGITWLADVISLFINWHSGGLYIGLEILVFDVLNTLQVILQSILDLAVN